MGTSMTCALARAADRGASCQTVILVRATASASNPPAGPAASVAVPGGSAGSARHGAPGPETARPRLPVSLTEAASPGPKDAEFGAALFSRSERHRVYWLPLAGDQAPTRPASGPVAATASANL